MDPVQDLLLSVENPTIVCPENQELKGWLMAKMVEYNKRLHTANASIDTVYKQCILLHVLRDGKAECEKIIDYLRNLSGGEKINRRWFINAWGVIFSYCQCNGEGVKNGSLPP